MKIEFRKYPQLSVGDKVKIYTKGAGNCISRKETNSRWNDKVYTIEKTDRDMTLPKVFSIRGIEKAIFAS